MTPEQEVEQEVLSYGFSDDFRAFVFVEEMEVLIAREREFEKAEFERSKSDGEHIIAGFLSAITFGGIFWGVVVWRIFF